MNEAKETYKKWHPEQFSDSQTTKKAKLDRSFLEYQLSKISGHSKEKEFEHFCKGILEVEVCPNLIPQTGPTGGGDSKVDTETYPVAEQLAEAWLIGYGDKACSERWAFAISAKSDWQQKIKSDVDKIAKTIIDGRKYTKIFFVSNQLIPDKKRAQVADDLSKKYGIEVQILSMDWLLDRVFRNETNQLIAVKTLGLSENLLDERIIGENDYKRKREYDELEKRLKDMSKLKASEIIEASKRTLILSREMEMDEQTVLSQIDRYNRLAKEYGTIIDQADAIYESAWTTCWWYPSKERFYSFYQSFENIVVNEQTTYLFGKICTLWMLLITMVDSPEENVVEVTKHREVIESIYANLISDENKPNTILLAKSSFQVIRIARGDSVDDIVDELIGIVENSDSSLEVNINTIAKLVEEIPMLEDAKKYDQLFELVVAKLSKIKHDTQSALMNAKRGKQLSESDPYKALSYFSKAVMGFYNEANTDYLMKTVFNMALLYEKIGLHWAARNYFFYVLTYCLNEYMKKGEITVFFPFAANELKYIELMQGRVIYAAEMNGLEQIARALYPGDIPKEENHFDSLLAYPIFQTSFEKLKAILKLPSYFKLNGLPMAAIACEYELGHYDKQMLLEYNESKSEVDDFMKKWANQPAWDQIRHEPWYGFEHESLLQSRIMGCCFSISTENDAFAIEFASTLLATLECILGTGFHNRIISQASRFDIKIETISSDSFSINVEYSKSDPTHMTIKLSEYNESEFQIAHDLFSSKLEQIISMIISSILSSNEDFQKLKEIMENESIIARSNVFTDSLFYGFSTFGKESFSFESLLQECEETPLLRNEKIQLHETQPCDESCEPHSFTFDAPPGFDNRDYSNDEIVMSDIINIPLWNQSLWCGALYIVYPNCPPCISLLFKNVSGLRIFDEWLNRYGYDNNNNTIGIRIVKQIDKSNPSWYRVAIGSNSFMANTNMKKNGVYIDPCRLHTMQPEDDKNLSLFEEAVLRNKAFIMFPSIQKDKSEQPELHFEKRIVMDANCIKILNAYEIQKNDLLSEEAIMPTDNPIIPQGNENCELIGILEHKRKQTK